MRPASRPRDNLAASFAHLAHVQNVHLAVLVQMGLSQTLPVRQLDDYRRLLSHFLR